MESLDTLLNYTSLKQKSSIEGQHSLFSMNDSLSLPELSDIAPWEEKELLSNEMDVLGFYVTSHPMAKYEAELSKSLKNTDTEALSDIKTKKGSVHCRGSALA